MQKYLWYVGFSDFIITHASDYFLSGKLCYPHPHLTSETPAIPVKRFAVARGVEAPDVDSVPDSVSA